MSSSVLPVTDGDKTGYKRKVCRICRKLDQDDLISVHLVLTDRTIACMIRELTGIAVTGDPMMPQNICLDCLERLKEAFQLQKLCLESDAVLRQELYGIVNVDSIKDVEDSVEVSYNVELMDGEQLEPKDEDYYELVDIHEDDETRESADKDHATVASLDEHHTEVASETEYDMEEVIYATSLPLTVHDDTGDSQSPKVEYICCGCSHSFQSTEDLKTHSLQEHRKRRQRVTKYLPYKCNICYEMFATRDRLAEHRQTLPLDQYRCGECGLTSEFKKAIEDHLEKMHSSDGDNKQSGKEVMEDEAPGKGSSGPEANDDSEFVEYLVEALEEGDSNHDVARLEEISTCNTELKTDGNEFRDVEEDDDIESDSSDEDVVLDKSSSDSNIAKGINKYLQENNGNHGPSSEAYLRILHEQQCYNIVEFRKERCCGCLKFFDTVKELEEHVQKEHRRQRPEKDEDSAFKYTCEYCGKGFNISLVFVRHRQIRDQKQFYMCRLCDLLFETDNRMKSHMIRDEPHAEYFNIPRRDVSEQYETFQLKGERCCGCSKYFPSQEELLAHAKLRHLPSQWESTPKRPLPCDICGRCFRSVAHLQDHRLTKGSTIRYYCLVCAFDTASNRRMVMHLHSSQHNDSMNSIKLMEINSGMRKPTTLLYCCFAGCMKTFNSPERLQRHVTAVHEEQLKKNRNAADADQSPPANQCSLCLNTFRNVTALRNHQARVAVKEHVCPVCGLSKPSRALLAQHERKHTGERPYTCLVCNKSFGSTTSLNSHMKCHVPKQYDCEECDEKFARLENLKRHINHMHREPSFDCNQCEKKFKTKAAVQQHQRSHTGERPFLCRTEGCDKRYGSITDRRRHEMSSHTQERPHKCSYCNKQFIRKRQVVIHERRHTGERPFVCKSCGKGFVDAVVQRKHSCNLEVSKQDF